MGAGAAWPAAFHVHLCGREAWNPNNGAGIRGSIGEARDGIWEQQGRFAGGGRRRGEGAEWEAEGEEPDAPAQLLLLPGLHARV